MMFQRDWNFTMITLYFNHNMFNLTEIVIHNRLWICLVPQWNSTKFSQRLVSVTSYRENVPFVGKWILLILFNNLFIKSKYKRTPIAYKHCHMIYYVFINCKHNGDQLLVRSKKAISDLQATCSSTLLLFWGCDLLLPGFAKGVRLLTWSRQYLTHFK